jgi:hypothetical protein
MALKPNTPIKLQNDGAQLRGAVTYPGIAIDILASANVANNATLAIGDISSRGLVFIQADNGDSALAVLLGGLGGTQIVTAIRGTWGAAAGGANNYNVYWDGGSNYRIENKQGSTRTFSIARFGNFATQ